MEHHRTMEGRRVADDLALPNVRKLALRIEETVLWAALQTTLKYIFS